MKLLICSAAVLALSVSTASAEVKVTIHDGLVSIAAKDATVRQIIAEWARVGQAKVVNAERLPGGPTTIELTDVPEAQALDMLLRSAAGYVAAPRPIADANLSRFDRVVVLPTSSAPRNVAVSPQPVYQQPQFAPAADDDVDDDRPQPNVQAPPTPRGPVFNTFPQQPQVVNPQTGAPVTVQGQGGFQPQPGQVPQQQPTTFTAPSAPYGGVAVPGMMVPAPQPQLRPGEVAPQPQPQQQQPGQVRRPGGGEQR